MRASGGAALRVELHAHTVYSYDGHIDFERLVSGMRRRALDAVAITDHDTVDGALAYRDQARRQGRPFEVVVGEERTLADGTHLIGLFLHRAIAAVELAPAVAEIRQQGGIVVVPHPLRARDGIAARAGLPVESGLVVEIFNPKCSFDLNHRAHELARIDCGISGGSDAHYSDELGECVNMVQKRGSVEESIRAALVPGGTPEVWGIRQVPGQEGRRYAPLYYRYKRWVPVPKLLVPLADFAYRRYRDLRASRRSLALERKFPREHREACR